MSGHADQCPEPDRRDDRNADVHDDWNGVGHFAIHEHAVRSCDDHGLGGTERDRRSDRLGERDSERSTERHADADRNRHTDIAERDQRSERLGERECERSTERHADAD